MNVNLHIGITIISTFYGKKFVTLICGNFITYLYNILSDFDMIFSTIIRFLKFVLYDYYYFIISHNMLLLCHFNF